MNKAQVRQIIREEIQTSFGKTKWEKENDLFRTGLGKWIKYMTDAGDSKLDIMNSLEAYVDNYFNVSENDLQLNENIGDILGYTALAIILGGSAYITYINNIKGNIAQSASSGELNPLFKKILDKVAPNWIKNREIRAISHKLSKIPEVMRIVNTPNKAGLRDELAKYLTPEEKQYLRDLTRNTIKQAGEIKEIAPSDFIKNKFPYLIGYDRKSMGSEMKWTLKSNEKMDVNQIGEFQSSAGYAIQGYGGPNKFQEKTLPDGTFEYTWTCYSSSD